MTTSPTTAPETVLSLATRLADRIGRTLKSNYVHHNQRKGFYEVDINGLFCRLIIWPDQNQFRTDGPLGLQAMHKIDETKP